MITKMKSVLMMGQSNMAGRGDFDEVPEIINPNCFMLRNGRWQPMREPINPDRSIWGYYHSGRGLAASFADEFAKHYNEKIGLIPCADGDTSLRQWMPGEILFDNAVNNALRHLQAQGRYRCPQYNQAVCTSALPLKYQQGEYRYLLHSYLPAHKISLLPVFL